MFAFVPTLLLFTLVFCHIKYCKAGWSLKELEAVQKLATRKDTPEKKVVQYLEKSDYTSVTTVNEQGFAILQNKLPQDFNKTYNSVFLYGSALDCEQNQCINNKFNSVLFLKTTSLANAEKINSDPSLTFSNGKSVEDVTASGYIATAARPMGTSSKYVMVDIGEPLVKFLTANNACTIISAEGVEFKIADVSREEQESGGEGSIFANAKTYFLLTPKENPKTKPMAK